MMSGVERPMTDAIAYSPRERAWLGAIAGGGLLILNGIFCYCVVFRPELLAAAMTNPIALAFIVEAFVMTGVLAYLLRKWKVMRLAWGWFVALALIGGLAFAVPVAALWNQKRNR